MRWCLEEWRTLQEALVILAGRSLGKLHRALASAR